MAAMPIDVLLTREYKSPIFFVHQHDSHVLCLLCLSGLSETMFTSFGVNIDIHIRETKVQTDLLKCFEHG